MKSRASVSVFIFLMIFFSGCITVLNRENISKLRDKTFYVDAIAIQKNMNSLDGKRNWEAYVSEMKRELTHDRSVNYKIFQKWLNEGDKPFHLDGDLDFDKLAAALIKEFPFEKVGTLFHKGFGLTLDYSLLKKKSGELNYGFTHRIGTNPENNEELKVRSVNLKHYRDLGKNVVLLNIQVNSANTAYGKGGQLAISLTGFLIVSDPFHGSQIIKNVVSVRTKKKDLAKEVPLLFNELVRQMALDFEYREARRRERRQWKRKRKETGKDGYVLYYYLTRFSCVTSPFKEDLEKRLAGENKDIKNRQAVQSKTFINKILADKFIRSNCRE